MKQLVPSGLDEYLAEHKEGDVVTGRMVEVSETGARVDLGEGVVANCKLPEQAIAKEPSSLSSSASSKADLSSLGSMLQARWKSGPAAAEDKAESLRAGQIRASFGLLSLIRRLRRLNWSWPP